MQYPAAMSDPNQIRAQNLVESGNSNYYVMKPNVGFGISMNNKSTNYTQDQKRLFSHEKNTTLQPVKLRTLKGEHRSNSVACLRKNYGRDNRIGIKAEIINDLNSLNQEEIKAVKDFIRSLKKHSKNRPSKIGRAHV